MCLKELILNKTSILKECDVCYYWYFSDEGFKFEPHVVCNGCHDVLMMSKNLIDIVVPNIRDVDYRCSISGISKSQAVKVM